MIGSTEKNGPQTLVDNQPSGKILSGILEMGQGCISRHYMIEYQVFEAAFPGDRSRPVKGCMCV